MADRKKVIFCTDGIFPHAVGGMQKHSLLLVEELAKMDLYDLIVIHPHAKKVFDPRLKLEEVALDYRQQSKNYLLDCYHYSKRVFDVLKNHPDAVIYSQGLSVWKGISKIGNRVIVNPHGLEPFQTTDRKNYLKTAPLRAVFMYIYSKCARIVSLGGKLTGILSSVADPARIIEIPNAVHCGPKPVRSFEKETLHMLFVGRFASNKGIHILMQAVQEMNRDGYTERYHYHLVGKGPLYEEYIVKYSFPNVTFHGFASDEQLQKMYYKYDAFVFPTLYEGMPTVVLEAMAAAMPVIVSDTGATAEQVDHANGFLIEKNNVRALKWALQRFHQMTPQQRLSLSDQSYERVSRKFTWQAVASRHAELFNNFNAGK